MLAASRRAPRQIGVDAHLALVAGASASTRRARAGPYARTVAGAAAGGGRGGVRRARASSARPLPPARGAGRARPAGAGARGPRAPASSRRSGAGRARTTTAGASRVTRGLLANEQRVDDERGERPPAPRAARATTRRTAPRRRAPRARARSRGVGLTAERQGSAAPSGSASSGLKRSSSASGRSTSRWRSTAGRDLDDVVGRHEAAIGETCPRLRAASRCTAARGLAPSSTLGSVARRCARSRSRSRSPRPRRPSRRRLRAPARARAASTHRLARRRAWPARRRGGAAAGSPSRPPRRDSRRPPSAGSGRAAPRAADTCPRTRSGSASRSRGTMSPSGCGVPSIVTWLSCIASSSAACVFGGVRLISSASRTLVKTGPGRKTSSPPRSVIVPVRSEGSMSGVNCTRRNSSAERARGRVREQRLRHAGHALEQHVAADEQRRQRDPRPRAPGRRRPCRPRASMRSRSSITAAILPRHARGCVRLRARRHRSLAGRASAAASRPGRRASSLPR